jgi:tol-pal system beta propeller repeat protein TolB
MTDMGDPLIGAELGGYRIVSLVGRGGMGFVYRAETATGTPVAIKVMAPEISGNPDFRERFIREADSVVEHPNVVPVYEAGRSGDLLYIAMLLVDGPDLKTIIANEGRLIPVRAASIFSQAAAALDAAHENGIVHRDVKPQNILVENTAQGDEHVYLTDFGLVKRAAVQSSFTSTAYLIGSVHYMAPEHIEGGAVDGRADVYALGCVLYESLTGSVPFDKENEVAVLWSHVHDPPPAVTRKVPLLSPGIDAIVAKAMAKSPNDRYLTAGEFAAAVATELGAPASHRSLWGSAPVRVGAGAGRTRPRPRPVAAAPGPSPRTRALVAAAIAALATLSGLAVAGGGREPSIGAAGPTVPAGTVDRAEPRPPQQARTARTDAPRSDLIGHRRQGGGKSAVVDVPGAALDLPRSTRAKERQEPLPMVPESSPLANTKIIFHHHYGEAAQGTPAQGNSQGELFMVDADAENLVRVTYDGYDIRNGSPAWSRCGDIAYEAAANSEYDDLWFLSGATWSRRTRLTQTPTVGDRAPAWSPDCTRLAFATAGSTIAPGPPADPVTTEPGDIYVVDRGGSARTRLTSSAANDTMPTWSPDGDLIAFASNRDGDSEIYVMTSGGTDIRRLTDNAVHDTEPAWSPDGRRIAFVRADGEPDVTCSPCDTHLEIWTMDFNGGRERRLTHNDVRDSAPTWSPDSRRLLYYRGTRPKGSYWIMRADGTRQMVWLEGLDHPERPAWQPIPL